MLTPDEIQAAADRIAAALKPKKIILFGSYARGDANEHSDLDLMVIEPTSLDEWDATILGRRAVGRMGIGVDVLVYDQETFEHRKDWCSSPIHWAREEGKVLYES
jgi:predicted nucleotidyltransferase